MILVDTSCWVEALRLRGNPEVVQRMTQIVQSGQAVWCAMVRLELWTGIGDAHERKILSQFEQVIPELDITAEVWDAACELAGRCRKAGRTAQSGDVLIAACARHHRVPVESLDHHFTFLMSA